MSSMGQRLYWADQQNQIHQQWSAAREWLHNHHRGLQDWADLLPPSRTTLEALRDRLAQDDQDFQHHLLPLLEGLIQRIR